MTWTHRAGRSVCLGDGEHGPGVRRGARRPGSGQAKGPGPVGMAGPFRGGLLAGGGAGQRGRPLAAVRQVGHPLRDLRAGDVGGQPLDGGGAEDLGGGDCRGGEDPLLLLGEGGVCGRGPAQAPE